MPGTAQSRVSLSERQKKREIELTDNALAVLKRRYLRRGPDGQPIETVEEMFHRVASHIATVEKEWGGDVAAVEEAFCELLTSFRFMPNSPTLMNAGGALQQLSASFVIPVDDSKEGIFEAVNSSALIHQTGGWTYWHLR